MTTRNKIISGLVLSTILASGLFAGNNEMRDNKCMMKKDSMHMDKKHGDRSMLPMFKKLNLTDEQETQIEKIVALSRENMESFDEAFTKDSFDKNKYMKIMAEKRDNMLKSQADVLEKSYAILTPKQKEQLKVLMDLRKERMNKKL
ncbi:MAG: Spy/CpxP family protein refolding chaperone [Aliarcobacter sp.]|nr:Spy/CpxP family protein refolding chaperone [Aliarcobacter sp.]